MKMRKSIPILILIIILTNSYNFSVASAGGPSYQEQLKLKADQIDNYLDTLTEAVFKKEQSLHEEQIKLERLKKELHSLFSMVNALLPKDKLRIRHKINWLDDKIETKKEIISTIMRAEHYNQIIEAYESRPVSELRLKEILKLEKSFLQFKEKALQLLQEAGKMLNRQKSIESLNELFYRIEALKLKAAEPRS